MGVYLTGVHLKGVYLINVHLTGVYLTGVHLKGVYLTHLTGVSYRRASLTGMRLVGVHDADVHPSWVGFVILIFRKFSFVPKLPLSLAVQVLTVSGSQVIK